MPKLYIKGIGQIEVKQKIGKIPEKTFDPITGTWIKTDKETYKLIHAIEHGTEKSRMKITKKLGLII